MTFDSVARELEALQGRSIYLHLRIPDGPGVFQMIDRVNEGGHWDGDPDHAFINFDETEGSVMFYRQDFVEAAWEANEYGRALRIRIGVVDVLVAPQ